jgi:cytochrome oxidase Cu insertion factor (SCO1/SenC/PrrC family)
VNEKGNPTGDDKDFYVYTITFDPTTGLGLKRFVYTVSGLKPEMKLSVISCLKK